MAAKSILLVDDDQGLLTRVSEALRASGYHVVTATTGQEALDKFKKSPSELIVLDIALPPANSDVQSEMDGLQVLESLRRMTAAPVIMLSSTAIPTIKVLALDAGADDYLTKPFDAKELIARVRALFRRTQSGKSSGARRTLGELEIAPDERRVWRRGEEVHLTAREFDLLQVLSARPGRVYSRDELFELAWAEAYVGVAKGIDVHIANLRRKIEDSPTEPRYIVTVRGAGYRFETPDAP